MDKRIERIAEQIRSMQILCDSYKDAQNVVRAIEPGLDRIALELFEIALELRSAQTEGVKL